MCFSRLEFLFPVAKSSRLLRLVLDIYVVVVKENGKDPWFHFM